MAEPARKLPEQDPRDHSWQPRVIAGGGEGGGDRGNLHSVPTGHNVETPAEEAAHKNKGHLSLVPALKEAEDDAAAGAGTRPSDDIAGRENSPNNFYKPSNDKAKATTAKEIKGAKERSAAYRQKGGRRRGILIGFGAGGGVLSIIAGFSSLLPLKMPGIMDTLVGDAGKRVEKVVERRAERVFLHYVLNGSAAAFKTGNYIVTGNPIGDLFANMRTSNFEKNLLMNHGIAIEPDGRGIQLSVDGKTVFKSASVRDPNALMQLFETNGTLSRADLRAIVRLEIPAWRFWKRAKYVNWLRIKYNIPRWGVRDQEATEKDEDYNKAVKEEHIKQVSSANMQNLTDFVDCAADAGDCVDKTDEGSNMTQQAQKAIDEAAVELSKEGTQKATSTVSKIVSSKLAASAIVAVPVIGWIDMAARLNHGLGNILQDEALQKKHAEYIKRSTAVLGATYAGYADQTKAGDMQPSTVGMFSENFDDWEKSASYGIIQSQVTGGEVTGEMLEPMERANETVDVGTFGGFLKTMYGTVGWVGRAPLELWFITVSQVFDFAGDIGGGAAAWIVANTPAKDLIAKLTPVMNDVFDGIMKFIGMYVDPLSIGPKLAMYIHQGFLGTFNDKAKEDGMVLLTEQEGVVADQDIRNDRIADLKDEPLFNRVFDLDNEQSLATTLVATLPSSTTSNPIGSLAASSFGVVSQAPANIARATTASAHAAPNRTSESLFGLNIYGAREGDLSAELDSSVSSPSKECPESDNKTFNHCKVDKDIVTSMNCVFVKCADMYGQQANLNDEPLFAYGAEGPLYGPDAVNPEPKYGTVAFDWMKAGGMLAALLPIGALEISRRKNS